MTGRVQVLADNSDARMVPARNKPCPCGSGRRYKECHGALAPSGPPAPVPPNAWIALGMRQALQAQREGRVVDAAQTYRRVLAAAPLNFNATHMLGLVEYEIGHYDEAVALIKHAIELRPELRTPRQNLRLLESMPLMETEICREVLVRMLARVDTGFDTMRLAHARRVDIVIGGVNEAERQALALIVAACDGSPVERWVDASMEAVDQTGTGRERSEDWSRLTTDHHPHGGWVVFLGPVRSPAAWLPRAQADGVVLVATRDDPCALIDRIDELAAAGYARPALLCATSTLARRLGVPATALLRPSVEP